MKPHRMLGAAVFAAFVVAASGCQEPEGPAEKAGKEIDKAAASVGESIERAGEQIQKAAN